MNSAESDRARRAMERNLDKESAPGHWLWLGRVNFFGTPVLPGHGQLLVSAAAAVYHLHRGRTMSDDATRQCDHELCVNPDCFRRPVRPSAARRPGGGAAPKDRCVRGHDLLVHRRRGGDGRSYCGACARLRARERWARRAADAEPVSRRHEYCVNGNHRMEETRRQWPNGQSFCGACADARNAEKWRKRREQLKAARVAIPAYPVDIIRAAYRPDMTIDEAWALVLSRFPDSSRESVRKALSRTRKAALS